MKEEDEWDSPHIVRYLEALSNEEIEKIKELAKPRVSWRNYLNLMWKCLWKVQTAVYIFCLILCSLQGPLCETQKQVC